MEDALREPPFPGAPLPGGLRHITCFPLVAFFLSSYIFYCCLRYTLLSNIFSLLMTVLVQLAKIDIFLLLCSPDEREAGLFTPQMPVKALLQVQLPANVHGEVMAPVFGSCNPLGRPGVPDSWGWPGPGSRSLHSEPAAGRARSHSVCTCTCTCICLKNNFKSHVIDRNMSSISSQTHRAPVLSPESRCKAEAVLAATTENLTDGEGEASSA